MYCPLCKAEYRQGVETCEDCCVPLVAAVPAPREEVQKPIQFVEILSTYNPADIAVITSILEGEGVTFYFLGEQFTQVLPGVQPARLMVAEEDADVSRELLEDLKLSIGPVNLPGEPEDEDAG